jgi:hypothetical protein
MNSDQSLSKENYQTILRLTENLKPLIDLKGINNSEVYNHTLIAVKENFKSDLFQLAHVIAHLLISVAALQDEVKDRKPANSGLNRGFGNFVPQQVTPNQMGAPVQGVYQPQPPAREYNGQQQGGYPPGLPQAGQYGQQQAPPYPFYGDQQAQRFAPAPLAQFVAPRNEPSFQQGNVNKSFLLDPGTFTFVPTPVGEGEGFVCKYNSDLSVKPSLFLKFALYISNISDTIYYGDSREVEKAVPEGWITYVHNSEWVLNEVETLKENYEGYAFINLSKEQKGDCL